MTALDTLRTAPKLTKPQRVLLERLARPDSSDHLNGPEWQAFYRLKRLGLAAYAYASVQRAVITEAGRAAITNQENA